MKLDIKEPVERFMPKPKRVVGFVRERLLDYFILVIICLLLGVFEIFVIKKSDNLGNPDYWYHAGCRLLAYTLAGTLGLRTRYRKVKAENTTLNKLLAENSDIMPNITAEFEIFIQKINDRIKVAAWRAKVNKKLAKLEKSADVNVLRYAADGDEQHLSSKKLKKKAFQYIKDKENLQYLLTDEYCSAVESLNVKAYHIYTHDFGASRGDKEDYDFLKTRTNVGANSAGKIGSLLIGTIIVALLIGSFSLSFDEVAAEEVLTRVVSIVVGCAVDVGFTLWKFVEGANSAEKVVEEEDLRVAMDKNRILKEYQQERAKTA